ncbi:tetratricopeptide repeat protein [Galenea microaerophila]
MRFSKERCFLKFIFIVFISLGLGSGCSSHPTKIRTVTEPERPPLATHLGDKEAYEFALGVAQLAIKNKHYQKAEEILTKVRQKHPDDVRVYRLLAHMYEQQGQLDLAWVARDKAIKLEAHTKNDEAEFARLSLLTHRYRQAEKIYQQWLEEAENENEKSIALNNLGLSAFVQQHYKQAQAYFIQALQQDPLNKKARKNLLLLKSVIKRAS